MIMQNRKGEVSNFFYIYFFTFTFFQDNVSSPGWPWKSLCIVIQVSLKCMVYRPECWGSGNVLSCIGMVHER